MKAALYVRVSTTEQAEEGHSVDEQLHVLRKYCEDKGWEITEVYEDAGFSGSSGDRPAFALLMEDVKQKRINIVAVHALDRFYRNLAGLLRTLEYLNEHGVGFLSITENMDFTTPWGKLVLAMQGSLAEIYLDRLAMEVAKGKQGRARSGLSNARLPAYGYVRENGLDHIVPEEAEVVKLAYETYAMGFISQDDLARLLTEKGYPTRRDLDRWPRTAVDKILSNPFYYGVVRYKDQLYPGRHEPIISKELWDAAQQVRVERTKGTPRRGSKTGAVYLLHRVARCWHCKRRMHMYTDSRWQASYYRDPAAVLGFECKSYNRSIRVEIINEPVEDTIRQLKLPEDWKDRILAEANHQDQRKQIKKRRVKLVAKLKRLAYVYLEGDISTKEYESRKAEINEELGSLQMPEDESIIEAGQVLESLAGLWDDLTTREKQEILRSMLRAIYIDIEERHVVCYEPFAEFAPLFDQIEVLEASEGCYYRKDILECRDRSGEEDAPCRSESSVS